MKSSKIKTVVLVVVLIMLCILVAGLMASVITGTRPQDWIKAKDNTSAVGVLNHGDKVDISGGENGNKIYLNTDVKVYEELNNNYSKTAMEDGGDLMYVLPILYVFADEKMPENFTESEYVCLLFLGYKDRNSDQWGYAVIMSSKADNDGGVIFSHNFTLNYGSGNYDDVVSEDGQIVVPTSRYDASGLHNAFFASDLSGMSDAPADWVLTDEDFNKIISIKPFEIVEA